MFNLDDFPNLDDLGDDPESEGGLGGATRAAALAAPARARALIDGETGLRFENLVLFAEPAFRRFELDLNDAFAIRNDPDAADPEIVAMLEAARLLWAYFELPVGEREHHRSALAVHLLGAEPSDDDWVEVEAVLDATEPYWEAMEPEERLAARQPGKEWLDWDALTSHPTYHLDDTAGEAARGYGSEGLSELEARALFAQPLMEAAAATGDADAIEAAMERASAYWQVAHTLEHEREAFLADTLETLAPSGADREALADEARRMLDRYRELFGSDR